MCITHISYVHKNKGNKRKNQPFSKEKRLKTAEKTTISCEVFENRYQICHPLS
jgi:hypothetical protein